MKKIINIRKLIKDATLSKEQIEEALKQCLKMQTRSEVDCCSRCPLRRDKHCYATLLKNLYAQSYLDLYAFASFMKKHSDFILRDEADENDIVGCIDTSTLSKKLDAFFSELDITIEGDTEDDV